MRRIFFVGYLVVIILISMICFGCGDADKFADRARNRYYPCRAITESGEKLSINYVAQVSPNDPIVTVVLMRDGKEYYYDLRK